MKIFFRAELRKFFLFIWYLVWISVGHHNIWTWTFYCYYYCESISCFEILCCLHWHIFIYLFLHYFTTSSSLSDVVSKISINEIICKLCKQKVGLVGVITHLSVHMFSYDFIRIEFYRRTLLWHQFLTFRLENASKSRRGMVFRYLIYILNIS